MSQKTIFRLKGGLQKYDWGKTGSSSLAARLAPNAVGEGFKLDEQESYAEVRLGLSISERVICFLLTPR